MTLKTSLIITGDASAAVKAVGDLAAGLDKAGAGARNAAAPMQQLEQAQGGIAASARQGAASAVQLDGAQRKGAASARDLAQSLGVERTAQAGVNAVAREATAAHAAQMAAVAGLASGSRELAAVQGAVAASTAQTRDQLKATEAAQGAAAKAANAHKAGMQNLSFQIQDVAAQLSTVSGPQGLLRIFAQQGGQLFSAMSQIAQAGGAAGKGIAQAGDASQAAGVDVAGLGDKAVDMADKVKDTGGKFGAFAGFLAGPWGAAILAATTILGPLIASLVESDDAQDEAKKSGLELVDALGKQAFATVAAKEAIEAYNEQQGKARRSNDLAKQMALDAVKQRIAEVVVIREQTKALLEQALARHQASQANIAYDDGQGSGVARGRDTAAVNDLTGRIKAVQKQIDGAAQTQRNLEIEIGGKAGRAAVDKVEAINQQYDREIQLAERAAASNNRLAASYDKTREAIERRREADLKTEAERNRKGRSVSVGNQVESAQAAEIMRTAQRYTGLSERDAGDRGQLRDLFTKAGHDIDPRITAWCAAFVNAVLATDGLKGTGNLSARSFLNYGESTDSPNKGDIVVSKRGNDASKGHVGFYQGTDAKGRVLVLGGNTGDKVGTQAIARTDVLGFRRAPSAADSYSAEQKAAADALKQQADDLAQVTARFLPATQAAKEYADELARIDKLAKGYDPKKEGSGLSPELADQARAAVAAARDKRLAEIALTPEAKAADDAKKSIDGVIASLQEEIATRKAADPVERAMIAHRKELVELAKTDPTAAAAREAEIAGYYAQLDAVKSVEEATREAARAQEEFRNLTLDALDAVVIRGEKAGDVVKRLAQTIASAALEAAVFGTGPLAALLKGGAGTPPIAGSANGSGAQASADLLGKSVGNSVGDRLASLLNPARTAAGGSASGGGSIVGSVSQALPYAALAYAASNTISDLLGLKKRPLGGALGLVPNVIASLLAKPKIASDQIVVGERGQLTAGVASGNGGAARTAATTLTNTVAETLNTIAAQLGGSVAAVSGLSIGTKNGKIHVNAVGGQIGKKGSGDIGFGSDEAAAATYAIQQAIAKGAVEGLSTAVQQAIRSSSDVNEALAEAAKVQDLELLVGGVTGQIDKAFRDFEVQAKERVRIAASYGFDLVAIEKRNAEDRAKVVDQLLKQQVGGLQSLIEELTQGDLFEGTALDKITALNAAIGKARADLDAGVEGAGDTLASLYSQRLATSKEAYGTTSAYAADRTATINEATAAVARANAQIAAAQTKSDPALVVTNAALDENNDQNARVIATLERTNELIAGAFTGGSGSSFNLSKLAAV